MGERSVFSLSLQVYLFIGADGAVGVAGEVVVSVAGAEGTTLLLAGTNESVTEEEFDVVYK